MIPVTHDSGSHLTTSRICRLLRPLRTKCKHLAVITNTTRPRGTVNITYASFTRQTSRRGSTEDDTPPLAIIAPPERLNTLSGSDRPSRDDVQFSKAIYDIRDAFRNVLQVSFGTPQGIHDELASASKKSRVLSLAAICASVIGDRIEEQAQFHDEEQEVQNEEEMAVLSNLYETIPPHFRRYTIVAHALSLVTETCPQHPSLLRLLLESSLSYELKHESRVLLRHLLYLAFNPPAASSSPRVAHPTHSNYLITLWERCCKTFEKRDGIINDRTFARAVIDVLVAVPGPAFVEAWTCKAVSRLARRILIHDLPAFTFFPTSMLTRIAEYRGCNTSRKTTALPYNQNAREELMVGRLTKWLDAVCQHIHVNRVDVGTAPYCLRAVVDLLEQGMSLNSSSLCHASDPTPVDLFICLAVLILNSSGFCLLPSCKQTLVANFLRKTPPSTRTYATLVALALPSYSTDDDIILPTSEGLVSYWGALNIVDNWARPLREKGCPFQEASLYSTFLSQLETILPDPGRILTPVASVHEFEELRSRTIDSVEDAERRAFGTPVDVYTPRKSSENPTGMEWRWEETFDCWVAKTPVIARTVASKGLKRSRSIELSCPSIKRRRTYGEPFEEYTSPLRLGRALDDSCLRGRRRHVIPSSHSSRTSTSLSPSPTHKSRSATASQCHSRREDNSTNEGSDSEDDDWDEDIFVTPFRRGKRPQVQPRRATLDTFDRRKTLFHSIVADALKNKIVLHPRSAGKRAPEGGAPRSYQTSRSDNVEDCGDTGVSVCSADQLSSDDTLNLFAYTSSEC